MVFIPNDKEICPLCYHPGSNLYKNKYYQCINCKGIFKPERLYPNQKAEKLRYESHNNNVDDVRYQNFVAPITTRILNDYNSKDKGLDFGAGTGPVITKILRDKGYSIVPYDPFFEQHPHLLNEKYNYIACCEVIEHFFRPDLEFITLYKLLKQNGTLYCMTHIYDDSINFENWYYKNDPTHVFIYQKETIDWIQKNSLFSSVKINGRLITFKK